jgi:hypothetical protein
MSSGLLIQDGVTVKDCRFEDCGCIGVLSYNHSARTVVEDNVFERMGTYGEFNPCVRCSGTDYRIRRNHFTGLRMLCHRRGRAFL